MALKGIIVEVDGSPEATARVSAALDLAARHQAHLTGVFALYLPPLPGHAQMQIPREIREQQRQAYLEWAGKAGTAFTEAARKAGHDAVEWHCEEGEVVDVLSRRGRYADLLVVRGPGEEGSHGSSGNIADRLVLESGRPVLVVPGAGVPAGFGRRVMLAWNASREAVRAMHDAMPLLERAESVAVVAVSSHTGSKGDPSETPAGQACRHLARHGIEATAHTIDAAHRGAGAALLAWAEGEGCDLLVMGAYGHSRLRELVLGGATAHVLRHSPLPVVLAH